MMLGANAYGQVLTGEMDGVVKDPTGALVAECGCEDYGQRQEPAGADGENELEG